MIATRRRGSWTCLVLVLLAYAFGVCVAAQGGDIGTQFIDDVAENSRNGLQSLLNWAIENSSPEALGEMAKNVGQDLPQVSMEERRAQLAEFVKDSKKWPSDSEIMNTTLHLIANRSEPESTRIQGLRMLQDIVEDSLLANELPALGGVNVLADAMLEGGTVRAQAMRVLGTAASNNVPFQTAVLQREAGTVQWLLQAAADALYESPSDAETLFAALKATAAMARNLPPTTTGILRAHIAHLKPQEAPMPSGAEPVDTLPESLQFLFEVVVKLQAAPERAAEVSDAAARAWRNAAQTAMGLLSDLAVNSPDVRIILQGSQAARAWIDLCEAVSGARLSMVQKAVQLLTHMHQPHHAPPAVAAAAWRAAGSCLAELTAQVQASAQSGDEWAAEVLQELQAAADLLPGPGGDVRDEL
eukprot:jgi/Ulvmu1/5312/UM022_0106.1